MIKHVPGSDETWIEIPPGQGYEMFGGVNIENKSGQVIRVLVEFIEPDEID